APAVGAEQEVLVAQGGDADHEHEGDEDAQFSCAAGLVDLFGDLGFFDRGGGHRAAPSAWVAANMTFSDVASSRSISAVMRPSCMTRMRSAMPSTSGSSEEIMTMARPWPASSESSRCTSA